MLSLKSVLLYVWQQALHFGPLATLGFIWFCLLALLLLFFLKYFSLQREAARGDKGSEMLFKDVDEIARPVAFLFLMFGIGSILLSHTEGFWNALKYGFGFALVGFPLIFRYYGDEETFLFTM